MKKTVYSRRAFLKTSCGAGAGLVALASSSRLISPLRLMAQDESKKSESNLREVMFYEALKDNMIRCQICPKMCLVAEDGRGACGNKENRAGKYYSLVYSKPCTCSFNDAIEKKPFYHFRPETKTLSLATAGCNFVCLYCQNWQISQAKPEDLKNATLSPAELVSLAQKKNLQTIAFTYSEPVVFYDYMYETARLARAKNIDGVMISNGFINEKPLIELCKHLKAVKIDLKSFSNKFYQKTCNGWLQPVLNTLKTLKKVGIWFEIVVLIIPTLNDSEQEIRQMCEWIKENLGPDVPLHFSRFHPNYKLTNLPRTPIAILETAWKIARDTGLNFAYIGNVLSHPAESTYCPSCKRVVIKRVGYTIREIALKDGKCKYCQQVIPGVW